MIIPQISYAQNSLAEGISPNFHTKFCLPNCGIKYTNTLSSDTVSFQSKGKKIQSAIDKETKAALARKAARELRNFKLELEAQINQTTAPTPKTLDKNERIWGISLDTAKKVHAQIVKPQERIFTFVHKLFDDMLITELSPKNLILHIQDRAKSAVSIMEKSATRKWNSARDVLEYMTDLNGAKLVMGYGTGKAETEKVLQKLIKSIKNSEVELLEIELQRPGEIKNLSPKDQEAYDYVSKEFLDILEDTQESVTNGLTDKIDDIKLVNRPLPKYTKGNYCALHLLLRMNENGARPFELQIMGPYMGEVKGFDDIRFKFFNGKKVEPKYNQLIEKWMPLLEDDNKEAKKEFLRYFTDSILKLRKLEMAEAKQKRRPISINNLFSDVDKYNLPPEYNLNYMLKIKRDCDARAKSATKNLAKAREQKATNSNKQDNTLNELRKDLQRMVYIKTYKTKKQAKIRHKN